MSQSIACAIPRDRATGGSQRCPVHLCGQAIGPFAGGAGRSCLAISRERHRAPPPVNRRNAAIPNRRRQARPVPHETATERAPTSSGEQRRCHHGSRALARDQGIVGAQSSSVVASSLGREIARAGASPELRPETARRGHVPQRPKQPPATGRDVALSLQGVRRVLQQPTSVGEETGSGLVASRLSVALVATRPPLTRPLMASFGGGSRSAP